jgi:hypothetical protein
LVQLLLLLLLLLAVSKGSSERIEILKLAASDSQHDENSRKGEMQGMNRGLY